MSKLVDEAMWLAESGRPGPVAAISFGVHGDERPPVDAGRRLVAMLQSRELRLTRGELLVVLGNPLAVEQGRRSSDGGVDLNRCFAASGPSAGDGVAYERRRAAAIVAALEQRRVEVLVDFHCTVEPGEPFLMQHPSADHAASRAVTRRLAARVLLTDPRLCFGGVSLDEWMSTRGRVGICYETGWLGSPDCTPQFVLGEMLAALAGLSMLDGCAPTPQDDQTLLELVGALTCRAVGFRWHDGLGTNLQALRAGTELGRYPDGVPEVLPHDATLVFPKRRPELVQTGQPLVYLAVLR
ncbi:MAG: succinylglutamate desuccinylase/aspartoacylase family protein [Planctomycetes bacterium]|nr:succinylglutamate desuccinylase/aspartoacylase family protein [Planctomycetota bacterium]